MAWTYDETDLVTTTSSGRLNVVRLLIGDTDTNDQPDDADDEPSWQIAFRKPCHSKPVSPGAEAALTEYALELVLSDSLR